MAQRETKLSISGRPLPAMAAWLLEESFLLEAGADSMRTERTYRSGLRLFADWLQHFGKADFTLEDSWPLSPATLSTTIVLDYREWLIRNRSKSTVTTYMAAVIGYLIFLDGRDKLSKEVQLGKLQQQLSRRRGVRNVAASVIDLDHARQQVPRIVQYYDQLPIPEENDQYNRRLSLLRDRAVVHTLYSTAARISECTSLDRRTVDYGRAKHAIIVGKGNKTRTLHLRDYARKSIQHYLSERSDSSNALFISHSRNSLCARLSITSVHTMIKKAVKALDLHHSLSAHDFRHYRATSLLREGIPLEVIQEFLGHADISTTRGVYAPVLGVNIIDKWLDQFDVNPHVAAQTQSDKNQLHLP